jgi:hypothetical protein
LKNNIQVEDLEYNKHILFGKAKTDSVPNGNAYRPLPTDVPQRG